MSTPEPPQPETLEGGHWELDTLSAADVRSRAIRGSGLLVARGLVIRLVGLLSNLALARLLVPHDFGLTAIGLTFTTFAKFLSDAGIGARLIGRPDPPRVDELRAVFGFQMAIASAVVIASAATIPLLGTLGLVTTAMVASIPIAVLANTQRIVLERTMSYDIVVRADVAEVLAYLVWTIPAAALGLGVWALVTGLLVRTAVSTAILIGVGPAGFLTPMLSLDPLRSLLAFGLRFQAGAMATLAREIGINAGVVAIVGLPTLGIWSFAGRFFQIPFILFESLWRVSYPALAALMNAGEDPRRTLERGASMVAISVSVTMGLLTATGPALIPFAFGSDWAGVSGTLPGASLALAIGGPVSVVLSGFLFAVGNASASLRSHVVGTLIMCGIGFSLLQSLHAAALGIGWAVASIAEASILIHAAAKYTDARLVKPLVVPILVGSSAAGAGWAICEAFDRAPVAIPLAGLACGAILLTGLLALQRDQLRETARTVRRVVSMRRSPDPA